MSETAKLTLPDGKEIELPIITGTENEKSIDIAKLRAQTGYVTLDPGFVNTASCKSSITFLNGEKGILRYRGYSIEDLCANSSFLEVAHLLINGNLPNQAQSDKFIGKTKQHALIHEDMKHIFDFFSTNAHPMAILSAMVSSLSAYYSEDSGRADPAGIELNAARLIAKLPTIASFSYKKSIGQPFIYPQDKLPYCDNFLRMMFAVPAQDYEMDSDVAKALDVLLILHADHEQNCSTSTVRLVGSAQANLYASVASGVLGLWGPLHGGANQQVISMLDDIVADGGNVDKYINLAKDKSSDFRLMGFGHRVYKNFDPRALIIKKQCDVVLEKLGISDPVLEIAKKLEERALADDYFVERKLFPNVDFYSGIIYRAIGIPTNMYTVMFALGRLPGWIAQWKELMADPAGRIGRPRQIYQGNTATPINQ